MPRPPVLPVPDRRAIFDSGKSFSEWLATPESPDQADRIREVLERTSIPDEVVAQLKTIKRRVHVIAIAETWCGDVIRHTPVLVRMVEANPQFDLRFVTREQHPEWFVRFLTNGGEAIPKFVFCSDQFVEVGNWGPMSSTPRKFIAQGKGCGDGGGARKLVGVFYESDNNRETIAEFTDLFQTAAFGGF